MPPSFKPLVLLFVLMLSATACGGGGAGGGGGTGILPVPPVPQIASVALTLKIPSIGSTARFSTPKYVSGGTQQIGITVNGSPVTATSTCSPNAPTICNITFSATAGSATIAILLADPFGAPLSTGTVTTTLVANQTNQLHVVFDGIPSSISIRFDNPNPSVGTAATVRLFADVKDAAGYLIVGDPYATPITVNDSDSSGHTAIVGSAVLHDPAASVTVQYDGKLLAKPPTFTGSASGVDATRSTGAQIVPIVSRGV
ncbi:MAG: hypothetical protein DLM50_07045, partial [Candidatus Meridianibacter frigidus]